MLNLGHVPQSNQLHSRRLKPADVRPLSYLVSDHWAVFSRLAPTALKAQLPRLITVVIEDAVTLRGFVAVQLQPPNAAQIMAVAFHDHTNSSQAMAALMPRLKTILWQQGVRRLRFMGNALWFFDTLEGFGFKHLDNIVTMHWEPQPITVPQAKIPLSLRAANHTDLAGVVALDQAAFEQRWHKSAALLDEALHTAATFFVAHTANELIGYAWSDIEENIGHITRLAIHPEYQGMGIGGTMLAATLHGLQTQGAKTITLNTQTQNSRSQNLYHRFGFVETNTIVGVYELKLKAPA